MLLSHLLRVDTPAFAEREGLRILPNKEIKSGATTNNYTLMLPCHLGSHIDSPRHYYDTAKAPSDYDFSQYVFERPLLLEIAKGPGELIQEDDLKSHQKPLEDSDVALIRTGFQSYRETAPKKYIWDSPGLSSAAAKYLCGFRKLRALGIDSISITDDPPPVLRPRLTPSSGGRGGTPDTFEIRGFFHNRRHEPRQLPFRLE